MEIRFLEIQKPNPRSFTSGLLITLTLFSFEGTPSTVDTLVLTKMFFENFIEESKSNKPCKWVITKHFRINN